MSKKPIHVVYIITKLELGGAQKVCLSLMQALQQDSNFASTLISGCEGPLVAQVANQPNVILLETIKREVGIKNCIQELKCFIQLVRILKNIKKKNPHIIVHTHSTKAGLLGRWAAWFAGISKRVHTVHGYGFHNYQSYITWYTIYFLELITSFITTHFICVSSDDVKNGIRLFPTFARNHTIIRAAIDWNQFIGSHSLKTGAKILAEPHKPFIVGTIACFKPQKNLFDLLQAFQMAYHKEPRLRLEIIGDGSLRYDIEDWILRHNLNNVITLHGWQEQVAPIMQQWHAFMLTSLWEGLPCAIIEARALSLPVISYKTGGIPDIITDNENGLLFEPGDWKGVAHALINIVQEKQLYATLRQARENLLDFRQEHMIEEHKNVYKHLINQTQLKGLHEQNQLHCIVPFNVHNDRHPSF